MATAEDTQTQGGAPAATGAVAQQSQKLFYLYLPHGSEAYFRFRDRTGEAGGQALRGPATVDLTTRDLPETQDAVPAATGPASVEGEVADAAPAVRYSASIKGETGPTVLFEIYLPARSEASCGYRDVRGGAASKALLGPVVLRFTAEPTY